MKKENKSDTSRYISVYVCMAGMLYQQETHINKEIYVILNKKRRTAFEEEQNQRQREQNESDMRVGGQWYGVDRTEK